MRTRGGGKRWPSSSSDVGRWTLSVGRSDRGLGIRAMKTIVINTGTELLLGDVLNSHLVFIAQKIFPLGLRVDRQLSVPDGPAIRAALAESSEQADIIFVTGGL